MQFLSQNACAMTDIPTVVLHSNHIAYLIEADRIQMARDGFLEINLACVVCFLDETIAPTIVIGAGKDTVFVIDDRGHLLSRWVKVL